MSFPTLDQVIPEGRVRRGVYRILAGVGFAYGAATVGIGSAVSIGVLDGIPAWFIIAGTVYASVAAPLGFLKAQANVPVGGVAIVPGNIPKTHVGQAEMEYRQSLADDADANK